MPLILLQAKQSDYFDIVKLREVFVVSIRYAEELRLRGNPSSN